MKLTMWVRASGSRGHHNATTKWNITDRLTGRSVPQGTKEEAFKRIVNNQNLELKGAIDLQIEAEISREETGALLFLTKKGSFSKIWNKIKDLPYGEFVEKLASKQVVEEL